MKGEAYYYMFSIVLVAYILFYFCMMVYFKLTGQTLYGRRLKPGSAEYKTANKLFSKRIVIIISLLTPISVVNLLLDIRFLAHLHNRDAYGILVVMPIMIAVITVITFITVYDQFAPKDKKHVNSKNDWPIV